MNTFRKIEDKSIDQVKIGKFIRRLRKSHNKTQDELADELFVTRQAISKWERGESIPSADMAKALSKTFGITLEEFYNGHLRALDETLDLIKILLKNPIFNVILIIIFIILTIYLPLDKTNTYDLKFNSDYLNIEKAKLSVENGLINLNLENIYSNKPNQKYFLKFYIDDDNILYKCVFDEYTCVSTFYNDEMSLYYLRKNFNKIKLSIKDENHNTVADGKVYVTKNNLHKHTYVDNSFNQPVLNSKYRMTLTRISQNNDLENLTNELDDNFFNKYFECLDNSLLTRHEKME